MNGQDGLYRSVRGATEVVGIVVLVGMVVTSASLLFMFASEAQSDIRQEVQVEDGVRKVSDIDSAATDVSAGAGPGGERIDLGDISPSRVHVVDAGYFGIEMNDGSPGFDGSGACSARVPLSAVVVDVSDNTDLVYFAGGIWRVDDSGVTVQTPPEIGLDEDGTLEFTTYNFQGEFTDRDAVVSEDSNASQQLSSRVQEQLVASEACTEQLDGNVENVSVTTAFEPTGASSSVTDAVSAVVPAYQRYVAAELGGTTTTVDTGSGTAVGTRIGGDALPGEADLDRNGVVDFAGDGPGEVTGDAVTVDKDVDNEYPVRMTLMATDVRNVTEVERTVEVPVETEVGLDREQRYPDYETAPVDAQRAVTGWDDVTFPGDVRTEAPDFEERTTDLYQTTTEYEFQEIEADNAFEQYQEERVDAPEQDPLEVVFVIDESGSMDEGYPSRSAEAKDAAEQFVTVMQEANAESPADARPHTAAVVGFGTNPSRYDPWECYYDEPSCEETRVRQPLTDNLGDVQGGIDDIDTYDGTPLWQGVDDGTDQLLQNGREDTNQIMVVLTDGKHNHPNEYPDVQDRIDRAEANGITVYTIGTAGDEDMVDAADLRAIAQDTGGDYTFVSDTGELESVFDQIVRDEIRSNVTVREPAPTQTVRMKVLPEDEEFEGTVPTDGVLTEWDDRDVVIAPADGAERVSMVDEGAGVVQVHYADQNDTYFFLNGTDPTGGDASARGAADVTPEDGDVVPEDPETREERVETDLDQTVEIAAYESEPAPGDEPAHDLQLQRNGNTLYLSVSDGDLQATDEDGRVKYVDDGDTYYFDVTDDMIPEPGTTEQWVDAGELPAPVDVQVLADGADTPDDADTVTVDGETLALRATGGWTLEQSPSADTVFWLTEPSGDTTYRFDLGEDDAAAELPDREDTITWQPVSEDERPTLELIAASPSDLPSDVESVVGEASVTVTEGGTTYLLRTPDGGELASTDAGFLLETDDETYRFDESDVAALSETDATGWFPADDIDVGMTVYDTADAVPDDAEGYVVDLGDNVTVVAPESGSWSDVSVSGTTLTYERAGTEYRLPIEADDLPPVDDRTGTETRIDRQVYSRPMTIDVTMGGETITTPWTDAESGLATDVTRVGATERDTVLTMADGESLSFDASVYDCDPAERERTGGSVVIGGETYNRTACTTLDESSADPATVDLYADGDSLPSDADAAPWQEGLRDALGSAYMDGDEVDIGDNQVVVVVEYDDASGASNYAVAIATIGDDAPDVAELLQIDVNQVEVDDDDDD